MQVVYIIHINLIRSQLRLVAICIMPLSSILQMSCFTLLFMAPSKPQGFLFVQ